MFYETFQVWEVVYSKDGTAKEIVKAMQLKGHKVVVQHMLCNSLYSFHHFIVTYLLLQPYGLI